MKKIILPIATLCLLLIAGITYAQHNTCQLAETVLDSLTKLHAGKYPDMIFYTDSSTLPNPSRLTGMYSALHQSKRPLKAIKSEATHVNSCTVTKVKLNPNMNPDSLAKFTAYSLKGTKDNPFINDAGVRFSSLLYSSDMILGYMQLNLRTITKFYCFIFDKNKTTGAWQLVKLVETDKSQLQ